MIYTDVSEFKELVDYYCDDKGAREEIAQKGYDRVVREHTMDHRIKVLLDTVNG